MMFYAPTQVVSGESPVGHPSRLGGLVTIGGVQRVPGQLDVSFCGSPTSSTTSGSPTRASFRICSAKGRASSRTARSATDGVLPCRRGARQTRRGYRRRRSKARWREIRVSHEMIPELGHFALILAFCLALVRQASRFGRRALESPRLDQCRAPRGRRTVRVRRACPSGCLAWAFLHATTSRVAYVAQNSNSALPAPYKIAAVWGAHEGSAAALGARAGGPGPLRCAH
mgnify:CR=1 FL=1